MAAVSEPEKPLHVRVAEVLGWDRCELGWVFAEQRWCGSHPDGKNGWDGHGRMQIPRYDTDWAAAGPLVERYAIDVFRGLTSKRWSAAVWTESADLVEPQREYMDGDTPLIAVCNLLLALHAAGRLKG